jgi:hypothetical protein
MVWRNAASGVLVSDLPQDLFHLQALWRDGVGSPVRAISFHSGRAFQKTVDFTWLKIPYGGEGEETAFRERTKASPGHEERLAAGP